MMRWSRLRLRSLSGDSSLVGVEDWVPIELEPGVTAVIGSPVPAWFKDPFGVVHLRGYLAGPTGTVFALPVGARPEASELLGGVLVTAAGGATASVMPCTISGFSFRPAG